MTEQQIVRLVAESAMYVAVFAFIGSAITMLIPGYSPDARMVATKKMLAVCIIFALISLLINWISAT